MKWKKINNRIAKISALISISAILCIPVTAFAAEVQPAEVQPAEAQLSEQPRLSKENGFIENGSHWYFLDGTYYYFNSDGSMATGIIREGETLYTFALETGSLTYAKREKNSGGGSFNIGFYKKECQELADNLNELKETYFDGDEDDDYYEDDKKDYDKDASFVVSGCRSMEVYLKNCDDADDVENKLLRSHSADEKKIRDRAVYYSEIGIAHENVNGKDYYMVIFMR